MRYKPNVIKFKLNVYIWNPQKGYHPLRHINNTIRRIRIRDLTHMHFQNNIAESKRNVFKLHNWTKGHKILKDKIIEKIIIITWFNLRNRCWFPVINIIFSDCYNNDSRQKTNDDKYAQQKGTREEFGHLSVVLLDAEMTRGNHFNSFFIENRIVFA